MTRRNDDREHDGTPEGEVEAMEHEAALAAAQAHGGPPSEAGRRLGAYARELARLPPGERIARARATLRAADPSDEANAAPSDAWNEDTARLSRLSRDELVARLEAVPGLHIEPELLAQLDTVELVARLRGRER